LDSPPVFENRAFHEAAHGVAAVEMGMVAIDFRLGNHLSPRNIHVDGSTGYAWPLLENESVLELLQRRKVVILAGIAWEESCLARKAFRTWHFLSPSRGGADPSPSLMR